MIAMGAPAASPFHEPARFADAGTGSGAAVSTGTGAGVATGSGAAVAARLATSSGGRRFSVTVRPDPSSARNSVSPESMYLNFIDAPSSKPSVRTPPYSENSPLR
ncbi:MAG: hypothetical protein BWY81_00531 [Firmicutes bacterium ADurb.Bin467]|nr:MAG: hypothetical protein BWY81_00531 [Firmicutes bacterium ADurb.Bin467]